MDRRRLRTSLIAVAALAATGLFASASHAQLLGGKGGKGKGGSSAKSGCGECACTPYLLNLCRGQHACCGCGCAHSGYCNWCGHGKTPGWILRNGGLLPRCSRAQKWRQYYSGHGYAGCPHGCGGSGNDLFYNYYAPQTGAGGGVPTDMYPAPHDTPSPTVQTYYTYQPWLPHEFLYEHNRTYTQFHGPYGMTQTHVSWGGSPILRHFD